METSRSTTGMKRIERWLLVTGLLCLAVFAAAMIHRTFSSRSALVQFDRMKAAAAEAPKVEALNLRDERKVDYSLWSKERRRAHQESLAALKGAPVAVLTVGRLGIRVPVFDGTDDFALNRGAGWIAGTARPGRVSSTPRYGTWFNGAPILRLQRSPIRWIIEPWPMWAKLRGRSCARVARATSSA